MFTETTDDGFECMLQVSSVTEHTNIGLSRAYSDRQLNSDSHLVCFIVQ